MGTHEFEVVPAGGFARTFPLAIGALLALGLVVTIAVAHDQPAVLLGALPALAVALLISGALAWTIRHPRVRIVDGVLQASRLPRLRTRAALLDLDRARVVDLDAERALQPTFRLMGTSLPGYRTGWFWLRDGTRAFLAVTDRKRVLVLPRRDGGPVLLSLRDPDALLATLRRARG
jgi:hypothetical protein